LRGGDTLADEFSTIAVERDDFNFCTAEINADA
jgi:hypothetical protein